MMLDAQGTPVLQYQLQQTPTNPHQQTPTNPPPSASIPRAHPRRPLHNLTPNASPHIPRPKQKKMKIPTLRAHLVQIKILENHQNGKDTHLRGLQIFAKDNVRERTREVKIPMGKESGMNRRKTKGGLGGKSGGGMRGLTKSPWDVEPTIR